MHSNIIIAPLGNINSLNNYHILFVHSNIIIASLENMNSLDNYHILFVHSNIIIASLENVCSVFMNELAILIRGVYSFS